MPPPRGRAVSKARVRARARDGKRDQKGAKQLFKRRKFCRFHGGEDRVDRTTRTSTC